MTGDDDTVIPAGSLILVTGINGYVGSHVADQLLRRGYRVRGTARSAEKLEAISKTLRARNPDAIVEGVVIGDMQAERAFLQAVQGGSIRAQVWSIAKQACKGVAGVIHIASDLSMSPDPNKVIPPSITGVKHALEAAAATKSVTRVVCTSSSVTLPTFRPGEVGSVSANEWNVEAVKAAWAPPPYDQTRVLDVYAASKVESEQWAWKYMQEEKPSFTLNTVLPAMVLGPILDGANSSMAGFFKAMYSGDKDATQLLRTYPDATFHVDVQDTAVLHVAALLDGSVNGERVLALGEPWTYQKAIEMLKRIAPSKTGYPEPLPGDQENRLVADTSRAVELLRKYGRDGFASLEQSLSGLFSR